MQLFDLLSKYWKELYPDYSLSLLEKFINEIEDTKHKLQFESHQPEWYKDIVVYSLYVDLFNKDFSGLKDKLDYLHDLGVNCLWLLPILDSPMKDAGFDIRNYDKIRTDLLGLSEESSVEEQRKVFRDFLAEAHSREIKVIFDIAINHTSEEHPWFQESRKSVNSPYRDYYIWSKDADLYKDARIIFKGLCESNWEKDGEWYFFHRFFEFQPDLNYRNPRVLLEMTRNFLFWLTQGVDGFRADAIPYLWKEEGTDCENLPKTHTVVKFFRAVLDYVRPHTLLLAEACQKPYEVVKYFGNGDECNAGYHFPLMPQMFKSLTSQSREPVESILSTSITPVIPDTTQWFTFLRCHDELSLELVYVSEEDRKYIHENYCHKPEWNFRLGQGISARLSELFDRNPQKIALAYSIMLTLPGTPIIYYGDEFGKLNDEEYYKEMIKLTGKDDTRFLVRGKINWEMVEKELQNPDSLSSQVFSQVKKMVNTRNQFKCFGRGGIEWVDIFDKDGNKIPEVIAYVRVHQNEKVLVLNNLSEKEISTDADILTKNTRKDMLGRNITFDTKNQMVIKPCAYYWISL
ncbi:MAG: alpha-glucosidase C-terminal domain-containing protein [Bacteroidales bacterium]|nr:alpha-glucosidase C-terminal domain-containing protein [Bacteroidales bacterium]